MKSIYITEPYKIEYIESDIPVPKKNEVLLKLLYGGICGSDLSSYRGTFAYFDYPRIPGHEFSAEIVEVDENNYGLEKGMIVTSNPYFNCGECYSCSNGLLNACMDNQTMGVQRDGAFSQYIIMPIERVINGQGMDAKRLALIEPFCIAEHGVERVSVEKDDNVLVIGAGTIGVFAAISAKARGAKVYVADVIEEKLNFIKENFDIDGTILNTSEKDFMQSVEEITLGNGFDVTIEAVGLPSTFQNSIDAACFGGSIAVIGVSKQTLDFDFTIIQKKELNIFGSRNALTRDFARLIELVNKENLPIEKVVTNEYNWKNAKEAFEEFDKNTSGDMLKVMLDFTQ